MAWVPNRAARARCIPFAMFMVLLALRGLMPGDASSGVDARWIYAIAVLAVGAVLAWYWREYGELVKQTLPGRTEAALALVVGDRKSVV